MVPVLHIKSQNIASSQRYTQDDPIKSIDNLKKIKILEEIDTIAKSMSPLVTKVSASLASNFDVVLIQDHYGRLVEDVRPLVRLSVSVIIESNKKRARFLRRWW